MHGRVVGGVLAFPSAAVTWHLLFRAVPSVESTMGKFLAPVGPHHGTWWATLAVARGGQKYQIKISVGPVLPLYLTAGVSI